MPISINGTTGISGVNGSAAAPAIVGGDSDTGIFFGTDTASIATAGTSRLHVDSSGQIGVNTTSPAALLQIVPTALDTDIFAIRRQDSSTTNLFRFFQDSNIIGGSGGAHINTGNRHFALTASAAGNPEDGIYLTTTGRVLVGTTESREISSNEMAIQVAGSDQGTGRIAILRTGGGSGIHLARSNGTLAAPTSVTSDQQVGIIAFNPYDGADYQHQAANIQCIMDAATGENDIPARLEFATTSDGATSPDERFIIRKTGQIEVTNNYALIKRAYHASGPGTSSQAVHNKTYMVPAGAISSTGTASRTFNVFNYDQNGGVVITLFGKHNNQSPRICDRSVFVCGNYSSGSITQLPGLGWSSNSSCSVSYSASGGVLSCTVTTTAAAGPVWIAMHIETFRSGSIYKNGTTADGTLS